MKKFILLSAALIFAILPSGTVFANGNTATYTACVKSQNGLPFNNMQVKVDNVSQGQSDGNGCFTVNVRTEYESYIILSGRKSFDPAIDDSNGLGYKIGFKTGVIESNTTDALVIPIAPVLINTTGVDNIPVNNATLSIVANGSIDIGRENLVSLSVGNDSYKMTGGNGYIQLGLPVGIKYGGYQIDSDSSYGYESFTAQLDDNFLADTSAKTVNATLQYPSPFGLSDTYSTLDSVGHAQLFWTSTMQAGSIRVYETNSVGQTTLLATLPYDATSYDLGTYASESSHYYKIRSANQYGYEGTDMRDFNIYYDHTPAVLEHFSVTPSTVEGENPLLYLHYRDYQSCLVNTEYFIGDDPGIGQAFQIGPNQEDGSLILELGTDFVAGTYTIGVRAQDCGGNWTSASYQTFEVTAAPQPTPEDPPVEE